MKANEIMAGDLLRVNHDHLCIKKDTIVEVRAIDADNKLEGGELIGSAGCRPLDKTQFDGGIWCKYLDPIPLTPEILEKNGFIVKHTESAKRTYWKDRAGQIVGHKNRGLMYMEISGNPVKFGYFLPHFSGHIQFVHELQHALRLCGISKEIVL